MMSVVSSHDTESEGRTIDDRQVHLKRRVILLGASNLTRAISTIVGIAQASFDGPLDIAAALGHGRSYGMWSRVLFRELPGIVSSGLWQEIERRPRLDTVALITDIGNDIFYGASVNEIMSWVNLAFDRLEQFGARSTITLLPVENSERISERRFRLMRRIMFHRCRLELCDVRSMIVELNDRLRELAKARGAAIASQRTEWYGFDPIHIRMRDWRRAWSEILSTWRSDGTAAATSGGSLSRWAYLRLLAPHERCLFGITRRAAQPAGRLADGSLISFY
jgi:hypothetical protein